jgi:hypothetical protein
MMPTRRLAPTLFAAVLLACCRPAAATSHFLFVPIGAQAQRCAALGDPWRAKVRDTLATARDRTAGFLPAKAWDDLIAASARTAAAGAGDAAIVSACERFIADYSDPGLSARLRGAIVVGLMMPPVSGCAAEFPDRAGAFRQSWISALRRNGLDPMVQAFDEDRRTNWRARAVDPKDGPACDEALRMLDSKSFDQAVGEPAIRRLLDDGGH